MKKKQQTESKTTRQRLMKALRGLAASLFSVLLLAVQSWAVPVTGFLEGTAETGWQGQYAVRLLDGTVRTGVDQMTILSNFSLLPLTNVGCTVSPSCVAVTNVTTSVTSTMSPLVLNIPGTANLGSLGTVSWEAQGVWLLPGNPSPTAAVLANVHGTLGGTTLTPSSFAFGFNGTLTSTFVPVTGGQALQSLRLDFTDGSPPPTSRTLQQGSIFINNGIPVSLGTPLRSEGSSVPVPAMLWPTIFGMIGLAGLVARRRRHLV
jgi:MYXO-CTERM domain-containing protein